jgi:hypothetical protein
MARYAMVAAMVKPGAKTGEAGGRKAAAPRANRARPVSDMLPAAGGAAFRRFGFIQSSVVSRWREIVGERYSRVCAPESIRFPPGKKSAGVLTLVVEGAHAPMMQHVAPLIAERVNRFFGYQAVERIHFRQGVVQIARARLARAKAAPPAQAAAVPIPADLGDSLREIADPELRACLESLARGIAASDASEAAGAAVSLAIPVLGRIGEAKK